MADSRENPDSPKREAKRRLRRLLFSRLRDLPGAEKSAASERICRVIANRPEFQQAAVIGAFVPLPSEPDLLSLIRSPLPGQHWCLPLVPAAGDIEYRQVSGLDNLITGVFGIREPDPQSSRLLPDSGIDLLLVPGVGFDPKNRARLGRGKGHYDRFLERLRALDPPSPVWGVCFSAQLSSLDPEPHDQPMDAILTEDGFAG